MKNCLFLNICHELCMYHLQQVKHLNLSRYTDMLASGNCRDDLDLVTEVHSPNGMSRIKPVIHCYI